MMSFSWLTWEWVVVLDAYRTVCVDGINQLYSELRLWDLILDLYCLTWLRQPFLPWYWLKFWECEPSVPQPARPKFGENSGNCGQSMTGTVELRKVEWACIIISLALWTNNKVLEMQDFISDTVLFIFLKLAAIASLIKYHYMVTEERGKLIISLH